jgi:protein transport protein SEC23
MSRFSELESQHGARFTWNVLPMTKAGAAALHVPPAALYTPFKPIDGLGTLSYKPVHCGTCGGILNPYCRVNVPSKTWTCPFCNSGNHFVSHYQNITATNKPAEMQPQHCTIEYVHERRSHPIFLFVVDTAMIEDELAALRDSLAQTLLYLPADAVVGFITFGRHVRVHELTGSTLRSYVFHGDKEVQREEIGAALSFGVASAAAASVANAAAAAAAAAAVASAAQEQKNAAASPAAAGVAAGSDAAAAASAAAAAAAASAAAASPRRFLCYLSECDATLSTLISSLTVDPFPTPPSELPARATGAALALAVNLLEEAAGRGNNARILLFVGGACTTAPGQVTSPQLSQPIRSHHDIIKSAPAAAFHKPACAFYSKLARQAAANDHVIDVFIGCLDQVGFAELRACVADTGGRVVLDDSFTRGVFQGSMAQMFACDETGALAMGFAGGLYVQTSQELQVVGAIGPLTSTNRKATYVATANPLNLGVGGTCDWSLGGLDETTTVAVYFDVTKAEAVVSGEQASSYVQFVTKYRSSIGETRLRVSTLALVHADTRRDTGHTSLIAGFDQEAAVVALTRWAVHKTLTESPAEVLRWLERLLISFVSSFATYRPMDVASFRLPQNLVFFPQFVFHLRRSQFLQVFNSSPDETAFYRVTCLRETVTNTLLMIQPTLTGYSLDAQTGPMMLDVSSCAPNRILLLDTFFHIVVWYGDTINRWRTDRVQDQAQYAFFAQLLRAPLQDAKALMANRFPTPRFIECVEKGSQSRFLMAKLNPSVTHTSARPAAEAGAAEAADPLIFTEDANLKQFLDTLKTVVVSKGAGSKPTTAAAASAMSRAAAAR